MKHPFIPGWLQLDSKTTKKDWQTVLKNHQLKSSFSTKADLYQFVEFLQWPWKMQWRPDQQKVMDTFFSPSWEEIIVQAIFGGGKTTMVLAIIYMLCLESPWMNSKIFICAFNIGIKNEIKKKIRCLGKFQVRTYDSLIYFLCEQLQYQDLKLLNFENKRKFIRENLEKIPKNETIQYVFVDESQDLEKDCYLIFRAHFPNAKFVFVGDIFQSIQKEPRESMLWFLLNRKPNDSQFIVKMSETPRVPSNILSEIQTGLLKFYPEFKSTIRTWTSKSSIQNNPNIFWRSFKSYYDVYKNIMEDLKTREVTETMILTFSSAITVRGSLGDIARFRRFFESQDILVNPNHKNMMNDRLFLTTANSSKGLERKHVICILTFPLELAFINFSNDLVMNLITVALSRTKFDIIFYVPQHTDRFSKVLKCFDQCPLPNLETKKKTDATKIKKEVNTFDYDPSNLVEMLQKEHSVTEILRQNILSFDTRQILLKYVQHTNTLECTQRVLVPEIKTEEQCALVGLLFESLILTTYTKKFPSFSFQEMNHHNVFSYQIPKIIQMNKKYNAFVKQHAVIHNEKIRFMGCFLHAQLHLFCFQKILIHANPVLNKILYKKWLECKPQLSNLVSDFNIAQFKTQSNVSMPFLNGIMDAACIPPANENKKLLQIFEIKASRSTDWKEKALLQAILYGICLGKCFFQIYLVNVFSKKIHVYKIAIKKEILWIRNRIIQDIVNWNMNCFLAKNVKTNQTLKKMDVSKVVFLDGRYDVLTQQWTEFTLCDFQSITKTNLTILTLRPNEATTTLSLEQQFFQALSKYKKIYNIQTFYVCPMLQTQKSFLSSHSFTLEPFFTPNLDWKLYVESIVPHSTDALKLNWDYSYATLSFVIGSIVLTNQFQFI